jgi:hypothetical protein
VLLVVFVEHMLLVQLDLELLVVPAVRLALLVIDRLGDEGLLNLHGRLRSYRHSSRIYVPRRRLWLGLDRFGWQLLGRRQGFCGLVVGRQLGRRRRRLHPFTLGSPSFALQAVALALLRCALVPLL